MIDNFKLTKLEKKQVEEDYKAALKQMQVDIQYFYDNEWEDSFDSNTGDWSNYQQYWGLVESISRVNINKYPYANVEEGNLIVLLPSDTPLIKDAKKYRIKFDGNEYISEAGLQGQTPIKNDYYLYYVLVGELI